MGMSPGLPTLVRPIIHGAGLSYSRSETVFDLMYQGELGQPDPPHRMHKFVLG